MQLPMPKDNECRLRSEWHHIRAWSIPLQLNAPSLSALHAESHWEQYVELVASCIHECIRIQVIVHACSLVLSIRKLHCGSVELLCLLHRHMAPQNAYKTGPASPAKPSWHCNLKIRVVLALISGSVLCNSQQRFTASTPVNLLTTTVCTSARTKTHV